MKNKLIPTAKQTRAAAKRRGDIAGHLGMAEMAMLMTPVAEPVCKLCDGTGKRMTHPAGWVEPCFACQPVNP